MDYRNNPLSFKKLADRVDAQSNDEVDVPQDDADQVGQMSDVSSGPGKVREEGDSGE